VTQTEKALIPVDTSTVAAQSDQPKAVTADLVKLCEAMTLELGIPITGLNILGGRPYVNVDGYLYKAHRDDGTPRELKAIRVEVLVEATKDDPRAKMKATIEFADGRLFEATAWHSAESEKMSTLRHPDNINNKAETKAVRRALRRATGIGIGFGSIQEDGEEIPPAPTDAGRQAQIDFWGWASQQTCFQHADGKLEKMAVHRALGVPERDGALREYIDQLKNDEDLTEAAAWQRTLERLEDIVQGVLE
jgi:hypothetical protein